MLNKEEHSNFVKSIREKSRLSQRKFGKEINVSGSYVAQVESGESFLSEKVYNLIKEKFSYLADEQETETFQADYYPDVFGSCGSGAFVLSEKRERISIPQSCFIEPISKVHEYSVINAIGNSMTPFINDRDRLIVQHLKLGEQIKDNRVYVFCYNDEIYVKRLSKNVNQLIIESDNKNYDTIKLQKEEMNDIIIIGQIVGLMRDCR